jgi:hypothetical protein
MALRRSAVRSRHAPPIKAALNVSRADAGAVERPLGRRRRGRLIVHGDQESRDRLKPRLVLCAVSSFLLVISAALVTNCSGARDSARWLLWSNAYKSEVLAQPASPTRELKHIEWDGWGFAGAHTFVFLAFDPTDALFAAANSQRPGKFTGLPCKVVVVRRLESHWYTVRFYAETYWGQEECG